MSLPVARNQLQGSFKELQIKWEASRRHWDDPVSRRFEEDHLVPLERAIRPSLSAIEKMAEVLSKARRECE